MKHILFVCCACSNKVSIDFLSQCTSTSSDCLPDHEPQSGNISALSENIGFANINRHISSDTGNNAGTDTHHEEAYLVCESTPGPAEVAVHALSWSPFRLAPEPYELWSSPFVLLLYISSDDLYVTRSNSRHMYTAAHESWLSGLCYVHRSLRFIGGLQCLGKIFHSFEVLLAGHFLPLFNGS